MRVSCGSGKPATSLRLPYGPEWCPFLVPTYVPPTSLSYRHTCNKGTRHRAAQDSRSGSCKRVPNALDIVSHSTRQDPEDNRARTRTQAAPRDPRPTPIRHEHTARTAPDKQERHALSGTVSSATMRVPPCDSTQTAHGVAAVDSCSRVASLQRRPLTESMSAAIFSSASIFSMTGSASRPACRMSKERCRSDQRDDRASAETSSRA